MIWIPYELFAAWFFCVGLCIGSFLNVCIVRIPDHRSIVVPPSACPSCSTPIRWYDNIPLISYLLLRGRCRDCRIRISPVYPLVELIGGLIFLSLFLRHSLSIEILRGTIFLCCCVILFFTDLRHMILPDVVTLPAAAAGLLFAAVGLAPVTFLDAAAAAVAGALTLLAINGLYYLIRRRHGMGFGDVKMMLAVGAFLGTRGMLLTLIVASFTGGLYGAALLLAGKKADHALPYGTFLAAAAIFAYYGGQACTDWYVSLLR